MAEKANTNNENNGKVKEILEQVHVEYLDEDTVKLTHGIDTCTRKVHKFPQHCRGLD